MGPQRPQAMAGSREDSKGRDYIFTSLSSLERSLSESLIFLFPKKPFYRTHPKVGRTSSNTRTFIRCQQANISGKHIHNHRLLMDWPPLPLPKKIHGPLHPVGLWATLGRTGKGRGNLGQQTLTPKQLSDPNT